MSRNNLKKTIEKRLKEPGTRIRLFTAALTISRIMLMIGVAIFIYLYLKGNL